MHRQCTDCSEKECECYLAWAARKEDLSYKTCGELIHYAYNAGVVQYAFIMAPVADME